IKVSAGTSAEFYEQVSVYAKMGVNLIVEVSQDLTLNQLINIPTPAMAGKTLTIRSVNSDKAVTLKRGIVGNLFTVPTSATLILENIIVDGAKASGFANGNGSLVRVSGGAFVMNAGAVLRDNVFSNSSGGGVYVNSGTFTMNGGSISGNTASSSGGGVYVNNGILTLGGTVAITDNFTSGGIASNVYLNDNQYISISSITPPATGMNIGITKTANRGVFVQSGAKVEHVQYFHEDVTGKESKFCGNALAIGVSIYCLVESYATAQTDVVIDVEEDLPLDWLATIPANNNGKTLTIRSAGPTVTLKRGIIGNLFTVSANAKLILENIIIDGAKDASSFANNAGALVRVNSGGVFTMNNGVILRNFCAGGVYVDGGVFTMTGGKISGNTVNCNQSTGVSVDNEGTFTMENGVISGNTASNGGGVYITNNSTFTMENGEISGNTVNGYAYGGGVYITNNSTFTMENGEISGNTAYFGGGVYIINNSTFTMENGEISGNTASNGGGGVYGYGTFTMSGGTISGNTAANGGGVNGTLTMNGGSISGNTAANGGGVYGTLTMNGGSISGNTASDGGGGVYGTFTMRGGEISNNKSAGVGGGVSGSFTMSGGVISGNTASIGGGVYNSGTFTMNGGSISGNTASSGGGVYNFGTFTMSDGTISGNTAGEGGGVYVYGNGAFTMTGGSISDNTASSGSGVYRYSGAVNLNGGIVVGTGTNATSVVFGNYNINQGVIVVWNKSADPFIYTESRNTHLTALPTGNATAIWAIDDDGKFGISYKNHDNEGFVEIADVIVKTVISGAIVSAPALVGKTYNTITINEVAVPASGQTVEYAVSTINSAPTDGWQTELVFAELASNTAYYIFARSQENIDYYAGIPLSPLITTTFSQNNWIDEADFSWYLSSQTEFTLTTAEQLAGLAYIVNEGHESFSGKRIILGSNISLNSTTGWQNWAIATSDYIKLWTPIGTSTNPFRGTFVGNGFKISGVYIDNANDNQGLFGVVNGGKIEKLGVVASYIKGNSNVGGLVGNGNTPIEYCYSMANVTGTSNIGGLIGNRGSGTITQSYATGNVIGTSNVGGLSGSGTGTVTQSYYNSETLGGGTNGFGRTTAEMKTQSSYIGWNFVTPIWKIDNNGVINDGYPYLREFKEVVTKPMLIANEFIYNALPRTVELNQANPAYTLTGDVTKTNAGNYTIAVTLSDPSRYEWADGTTTDIALSWSIAKAQIAKPTVTNTNLVYTGSAQSAGIVANTAYEVSNGTATNANSNYIASVTLKDKANHEWTDGTITDLSLPWSINLKNITITSAAALSKTYDGNESANAGAISFDGLANSEILILGTDYSISAEFTGGNYNAGDSKPYAYTVAIIPNAKTNNYNLSANAYNGTNGVINKANPTYTIPTNLTANYGDLLSDVKLPTGWSWQKTGTVGEVGMQTHKATFTPEDAKNYNAILDVELTITVNSIINTSQDNIDIAAAKATIESTEFGPIPQSILNTQGMARGFVEANLELNGVTYTVVNNSFIAAVAGTVSDIFGTNGLYTFTVKLNKGIGTEQEYVGQLVIVATKYEPPMQGEQCEDGEELVDGKCTTKTIGMVFAAQTIGILKIGESFSIQGLSKAETVRIVDVKGKILMSKTVMPNESVSIVHLPKGMYLVNVNGKTFRMAK
ncbi:MAG: right-handed parallel beta-helix repeat-containing protein, partial [Fibromonadales bacterium]|nr:right-handed parallel beta-helix repeat-containing protein [Fibromonadales bacterium]